MDQTALPAPSFFFASPRGRLPGFPPPPLRRGGRPQALLGPEVLALRQLRFSPCFLHALSTGQAQGAQKEGRSVARGPGLSYPPCPLPVPIPPRLFRPQIQQQLPQPPPTTSSPSMSVSLHVAVCPFGISSTGSPECSPPAQCLARSRPAIGVC